MALSRSTRVNLLIGNGHFLSHFYVLCLPPLFLAWQSAFNVSFAELGLAIALMSGTTAVLQTPVGFLVFLAKDRTAETLSAISLSIPKRSYDEWLAAQPSETP